VCCWAASAAIGLFNQWWNSIRFNTYITSISLHDKKEDMQGRLSMWRAFGRNTASVAFVFNLPWYSGAAQALNLIFSPVAYSTKDEAHVTIVEVAKDIQTNVDFLTSITRQHIINAVFNMLLVVTTCSKHQGFREGQEWRAIYSPRMRPSPLVESATEVIGGAPQIIYKIPLDVTAAPILAELDLSRIFDRLIIGPSPYPTVIYEAFVDALTKANITGATK
jgi:hypothetical protein